jgi:hypothetical protein
VNQSSGLRHWLIMSRGREFGRIYVRFIETVLSLGIEIADGLEAAHAGQEWCIGTSSRPISS